MRILILTFLAAITSLGFSYPSSANEFSHEAVIPFIVHLGDGRQAMEGRILLKWTDGSGCREVVSLWNVSHDSERVSRAGTGLALEKPKSYIAFGEWDDPDPMVMLFYAGQADLSDLDELSAYLLYCWSYPACWQCYEQQVCIDGETVNLYGYLPPEVTFAVVDESQLEFAVAVDEE